MKTKFYLLGLLVLSGGFLNVSSQAAAVAPESPADSAYFKNCKSISQPPAWVTDAHGLSRAQVIALYNYTLGEFSTLNPALEKGVALDDCQKSEVELMDSALKKIPPFKGTVYRGASARHFRAVPNQKIVLKAYTSTSKSKEGAEAFIRGRLLNIKVKSGRSITTYSNAPNEAEILLPRGVTLLIKSVKMVEMELFSEERGPYKAMVEVVTAEEI